jgi:uncharacterized protein
MSENVQKLQNLYAAFGRGDINAILENVSDGVTWGTDSIVSDVPWYSIRTGRAGVADFFSTLDREVEFTEFAPKVFAGAGDQVLVQVDIAYRMKKNGQAARVSSIHQFVVGADGKVTSFRAHEDTASVARAWNA